LSGFYLDGQASIASPSLRRTLEWSRTPVSPAAAVGATSITARVQGGANRVRLENAALTLGGSTGRGVLDLSLTESKPAISGTLAFDKLDLRSFLSAFMPIAAGEGSIYEPIDTGFTEQLALDLRLSAANAALGKLALTDVAASAQVKGGLAVFDISDATAFDGTLQAGLRIDAAEEAKTVEMRVMATEIDALALAKAAGAERLLPQGRATISATLKGTGRDWNTAMGNAEGSVTATLGAGALAGMDMAKFRERWAAGGFFALSDVFGGTLPLRGMDFRAKVNGGVARVEKADILLDGKVLKISGIIPYFGRALALSGHVAAVNAEGEPGEAELPFFIGGAWETPFVSPARPAGEYE
jgi:AsmA protein